MAPRTPHARRVGLAIVVATATCWASRRRAAELRAELLAPGVVTAHNHVVRGSLRDRISATEAETEFLATMPIVLAHLLEITPEGSETATVVLRTTRSLDHLMPELPDLTVPGRCRRQGAS